MARPSHYILVTLVLLRFSIISIPPFYILFPISVLLCTMLWLCDRYFELLKMNMVLSNDVVLRLVGQKSIAGIMHCG